MNIAKKRIKTRIEEIEQGKRVDQKSKLPGLQEALSIIEKVEQEQPQEAWGDY